MDAIKTAFIWPFHTLKEYSVLVVGYTLAVVPAIVRLLCRGPKSLTKNTDIFHFLSRLPFGCSVFSSIIYFMAPYSSSIGSTTRCLQIDDEKIEAVLTMDDLPWLRNPFGSVHAVALTNLGELTSGLCLVSAMQHIKGLRGIPVRIDTEYFKKARGRLIATTVLSLKELKDSPGGNFIVVAYVIDSSGVEVAKCSVTWSLKAAKEEKKRK